MPHSTRSSAGSAACRLEWRPSRWLVVALLALGLLAAGSVIASELPRFAAWPSAAAALACGWWMARREARRPARWFAWPGNGAPVTLDGMPIDRVAELIGIPVGTAHSRLHYAMRGLRAALDADARPTTQEAAR